MLSLCRLSRVPQSLARGSALQQSVRYLSIHEHCSMGLLGAEGVNIPKGRVAKSAAEAQKVAEDIGGDVVVKAMVLAGGRGKGTFSSGLKGGVKMAYSPEQASEYASKMIGYTLVTKQTGAGGRPCNEVFLAERLYSRREYYFAILMDRAHQGPVLVGSSQGGMDIEAVAAESPEAIITKPVDVIAGLSLAEAEDMALKMGFSEACKAGAAEQMMKLYKIFIEKDASLVEINPMAEDVSGRVVCMDAKINFDDNASFRQHDVFAMRDEAQEDPREVAATQYDLNYIGLDGHIGCLVNGAGLAMATMDIIKLYGSEPANFLDVGGAANENQVTNAFRLISADSHVQAIFVNIFGGILRCDVIAKGIIAAAQNLDLKIPIVTRLKGNHMEEARELISKSGLPIICEEDFDKAAKAVVVLSRIQSQADDIGIALNFKAIRQE